MTALVTVEVGPDATVVATTVGGGGVATAAVVGGSVDGVVVTGTAVVAGLVARAVVGGIVGAGIVGAAVSGGTAIEGRTTTMDGTGAAVIATGTVETDRVVICWLATSRRDFKSSSCF